MADLSKRDNDCNHGHNGRRDRAKRAKYIPNTCAGVDLNDEGVGATGSITVGEGVGVGVGAAVGTAKHVIGPPQRESKPDIVGRRDAARLAQNQWAGLDAAGFAEAESDSRSARLSLRSIRKWCPWFWR